MSLEISGDIFYMVAYDGFENLRVSVVDPGMSEPFRMFWDWYKMTWSELHSRTYDSHDAECVKACIDVASRRALPAPLEVLSFQVKIEGLSRVALAQITRGRVGHVYNVLSQMPRKLTHGTTVPKNVMEHPMFASRAAQLVADAEQLYDDLYEAGIPPQDCRYVTLHGQQTSLMWHVNFAALSGWFSRRCENGLTDELNFVGRMVRRDLINQHLVAGASAPFTAEHDKLFGSGWWYLINMLDAVGSNQKQCVNNDQVFGNTGRYKSAGAWVPSTVNAANPADYRFDKSAFYHELLEIDDSLLFLDEREMINDWESIGFDGRLKKLNDSK